MFLRLTKKIPVLPEVILLIVLVLMRLPDLGYDTFNTDVHKWKARTYNFLGSITRLDLKGTYQTYHPGVPLMFLGSLGVVSYNNYYELAHGTKTPDGVETLFGTHSLQKFFVVLFSSLLFVFSYYVLRAQYGTLFPLIVILLLNTEPFFVAHTREFHLEGLVTAFMFASAVLLLSFLKTYDYSEEIKYRKSFIISALLGSLTILTKSSGLFILPFSVLLILSFSLVHRLKIKSIATLVVTWVFVFLAGFVAFWPSMWVRPLWTVEKYFTGVNEVGLEGEHLQLYFGNYVENPGIGFYPLNLLLRVTPEVLLLSISALFFLLKLIKSENRFKDSLFSAIAFVGFFLIYLSIPTKKLDRYIIPMFPFLALISGYVLYSLFKYISLKFKPAYAYTLFFLLIIYRIGSLIYVHPNYLFYYSPVVGPQRAIFMVEPKWAMAGQSVGSFFNNKQEGKFSVAFPEKYFTQLWPFVSQKSVIMDRKSEAKNAKYFVFPVWEDLSSSSAFKLNYIGTIDFRGVALYKVYEQVF